MADATYTLTEDYYEPLSDGSGHKKLFSAGQQIAWETAYAVGLVKTKHAPKAEEKPARAEK
jgi:hypothetical protein